MLHFVPLSPPLPFFPPSFKLACFFCSEAFPFFFHIAPTVHQIKSSCFLSVFLSTLLFFPSIRIFVLINVFPFPPHSFQVLLPLSESALFNGLFPDFLSTPGPFPRLVFPFSCCSFFPFLINAVLLSSADQLPFPFPHKLCVAGSEPLFQR